MSSFYKFKSFIPSVTLGFRGRLWKGKCGPKRSTLEAEMGMNKRRALIIAVTKNTRRQNKNNEAK